MEVTLSRALATIVAATLVTCAWKILNWVWVRPKKLERLLRQQGLSGNSYRLYYGDTVETKNMTKQARLKPINLSDDTVPRLIPFFKKSLDNLGKNCFVWLGPVPRLLIMDPELIREILTKHTIFVKPNSNPLSKMLSSGLPNHEGQKWAKHRKIINPAFHVEKLKHMLPAFYISSSNMVKEWEKKVYAEGSCEVDVWPHLQNMTSDVISRTAFGSSYEEGRLIFQLLRQQGDLTSKIGQDVYIPGWRFLPTTMNKKLKKVDKNIRASLRDIINKRVKAMKAGEAAADDLLGILLESNFKEIQQNSGLGKTGLSINDVIEECKIFYFAGQETTSVLLVWAMILLSVHPNWQTRAREEVFQVFGRENPDFEGLNRLKVTTMILYEVLRLYPPVVMLARGVSEDTKLGELCIPPGVQVLLPLLLLHHDQEIWGGDAKEFKPDRFADGVSKATKSQTSFMPFSWGPRVCIGQNFAMVESKMALAMILQRFSFELSPSYAHAPFTVVTVQPQYGAQLILHKV